MFGRAAAVGVTVAMLAAAVPAAGTDDGDAGRSVFIVELDRPGAASHASGRFDPDRPGLPGYIRQLDGLESSVLARAQVDPAQVLYRYRTVLAGFAARLTVDEAERLRASPDVAGVTADGVSTPLDARNTGQRDLGRLGGDGNEFLRLPQGLWHELGGPDRAGAGVVIGVIDSGVYPEHPSFAGDPGQDGAAYDGPGYPAPRGWRGVCEAGEAWDEDDCNHKLIGARWFARGYGHDNVDDGDFLSARDSDGHGTGVAAVATGNYGVRPLVAGGDAGVDVVSGVAPRASLAVYKVCWAGRSRHRRPPFGDCADSDRVAAVDAAVADGVDVINSSLGSSTPDVRPEVVGPVERALLGAVDAGVFVVAAAGNDGPAPGTVGVAASVPWVVTVGASTLGRQFSAAVTVRSGPESLETTGASVSPALGEVPLVDGGDCTPGTIGPGTVTGQAVMCRGGRGVPGQSRVVREGGGVGVVVSGESSRAETVADVPVVPAVGVGARDGVSIGAMLAGDRPVTVRLGGARPVAAPGDAVAEFSARGPGVDRGLLKPDLVAPGVGVLTAATPESRHSDRRGKTFRFGSGTSVAAPHLAGVAALLRQLDPEAGPDRIRSALMTTTETESLTVADGGPAGPRDVGAGRLEPNRAARPGLVLQSGSAGYRRYVRALADRDPDPVDSAGLNLPSVWLRSVGGSASVSRVFTNVDERRGRWSVSFEGLRGIDAAAEPGELDLGPGAEATVRFTFTRREAPLGEFSVGAAVLRHQGDGRTVRIPVGVRPVALAVPAQITVQSEDSSGSQVLRARAGYDGTLEPQGSGPVEARLVSGRVGEWSDPRMHVASAGVEVVDVEVPPGTQVLAAELRAGRSDRAADLDLFLFHDDEGDGFAAEDRVGASAGGVGPESITLVRPAPGRYRFSIAGFATRRPSSRYEFSHWLVPGSSPSGASLSASSEKVRSGKRVSVPVRWSGVSSPGNWLGFVTFGDPASEDDAPLAATVVRIERPH